MRDRDATMDRLVAAGFSALAEGGFGGFGVNGVARAAGCDKKLIYRYFDGLDGLLAAMGRAVAADLAAALGRALEPRPATYPDLMERLALALLDHLRADARAKSLLALEALGPAAALAPFRLARGEALRDWLLAARGDLAPPPGLDAPALNAALVAAAEGLAMLGPLGLDREAEARSRDALRALVRAAYAA